MTSVAIAGPSDLKRLLDAVLVIGTGLDLGAMLQKIVEEAAGLVDARYGALGVLDESGEGLSEFIAVGLDNGSHACIGDLPKGLGLLASLIVDAVPLRVAPLREHPDSSGFPPNHPLMTSFLGVPIRVRGDVFANLYLTDKTTSGGFTNADEELLVGLATAAGVTIDNARQYEHGRLREAATAAMNEVAMAVLAGADQRSSLELVARKARQLLTADMATIALLEPSGRLVIAIIDGSVAEALNGERVVVSGTIASDEGGTSERAVVDDASQHDGIRSDQLRRGRGHTPFVALIDDGKPFGTLTVTRAAPGAPFTTAELEVGRSFATQASVVLAHGRARQHQQQLMLLDDQERIGRDLHDTVIQRLFATGLALRCAVPLITDSDAKRRIDIAVDQLDRTIGHIRTVIFDIETSSRHPATSVRARILELADDAARSLGFQPQSVFSGTVDTTVTGQLLTDLLATVEEGLSNVIRHADASRVDLELSVNDAVTLRVVDDGIGMPGNSHRGEGHGIVNMRARAEHLGGTLDVSRPAVGGTEVCWRVPVLLP